MTTKLQTKSSVFALVKETTEGTPVAPGAATDFVAFQEGFELEPAFSELTNAELQSSIGMAKPALGFEEPSASFNHYIRHSGVEGQEPNWKHLLEAVLGGKSVAANEYNTVASSTVSLVKVDTGEGATFERGEALLVKHASNPFEFRNVLSISNDDLSLAHTLKNAPGTGVNLGKACLYKPANSGHPTLSLWSYRANGGAVEMISGCRVLEMALEMAAGEFVNGSFSLEGVQYYFDPIIITTSNNKFDFDDGSEKNVSVAAKVYKDPYELAQALQDACNEASSDEFTVTYNDSTRKFTIASDGSSLSLLWNSGTNTAQTIGAALGFSVAADDTSALTYTSDNALSWAAGYTPDYDDSDPLVAKANEVLIGNATDNTSMETASLNITIANEKTDVMDATADSGKSGSVIIGREVTIEFSGYLSQGQAEEFKRFRANDEIYFTYNFGAKSGGNWVAGKCVNMFSPSCKIQSFNLGDSNGIVTLEMTLKAFVKDGAGEFYVNFL